MPDLNHFPANPVATIQVVHLYGGPLDGRNPTVSLRTQAFAHETTGSLYNHCPHASQRLGRPTFIHQDIAHDALAP